MLIDPARRAVLRVIALQYNPDTLIAHAAGAGGRAETGDRLEALRLKGPPNETIKLDAEIDATDQLEFPDQQPAPRPSSASFRSSPRSRPSSIRPARSCSRATRWRSRARSRSRRSRRRSRCSSGARRARSRCASPNSASPRRPSTPRSIRSAPRSASACACSRRTISASSHKGGNLFMTYLRSKEQLANLSQGTPLSTLGITGIP